MLQLAKNIVQKPTALHLIEPKRNFYPKKQRALAVFYLTLSHLLEQFSFKEGLKFAKKKIKSACKEPKQLVSLAIDKWQCKNSKFLNTFSLLLNWQEACLIPVGPSTGEALKVCTNEKELKIFLKRISNSGINCIEGGNDLNCLENAAIEKFILRPSFAVDIQQGFTDSIAERIAKIEELSRTTNRVETITIFPHKRFSEFGSPALKAKSIEKYLNILRNCRKTAPSIPYLRAPISAFGNVLPEELAIREVNDFGHFAIDQESAIALGLEQLNHNYQSLFL